MMKNIVELTDEVLMMAKSGLRGPYPLTEKGINENVTRQSPGAYALGRSTNGIFHINYVGRSDSDLKKRLRDHIGENSEFKYEYYASSEEAFEKECDLYHSFNPPRNKIHPAQPADSDWQCMICELDELFD